MGDGTPIEGLVSSFDSETEKETALLMEEVAPFYCRPEKQEAQSPDLRAGHVRLGMRVDWGVVPIRVLWKNQRRSYPMCCL